MSEIKLMKRGINIALSIIVAVVLFAACKPEDQGDLAQEAFEKQTEIGIYSDSRIIYKYNPSSGHYSISTKDEQVTAIRLQSDGVTQYVNVDFADQLAVDAVVASTVTFKGISLILENPIDLKVVNMSDDMVWLWDSKNLFGYLLPLE